MKTRDDIFTQNNSDLQADKIKSHLRTLLLFNDEVNTIDHVVKSLIDVCGHSPEQAEQCATIAHFTGKCDIKKGSFSRLRCMKDQLLDLGLEVVIK